MLITRRGVRARILAFVLADTGGVSAKPDGDAGRDGDTATVTKARERAEK